VVIVFIWVVTSSLEVVEEGETCALASFAKEFAFRVIQRDIDFASSFGVSWTAVNLVETIAYYILLK
jgi:hypothetical protein